MNCHIHSTTSYVIYDIVIHNNREIFFKKTHVSHLLVLAAYFWQEFYVWVDLVMEEALLIPADNMQQQNITVSVQKKH